MRQVRKRRALLAVGVSALLMITAACLPISAADENLLKNGGFENGLDEWEAYMDEPSVELSTSEKHDGKQAIKLNGIGEEGEEHWNKIRQSVEVTPNTNYTVSGWAKITGAPIDTWKSKFEIETENYEPFVTLRIHDMGTKPTGDWQAFSFDFNSGDNDLIRLSLCADNGGKKNIHYYDDLVMVKSAANAEPSKTDEKPGNTPSLGEGSGLIKNGGFESGKSGWESGWGTAETIVEEEKAEGTKALRITDCRWESNVHQFIKVEPHTDYVISFQAKVVRAEDEWSTLVKVGENDVTLEELGKVNMRKTSGWKEYQFEISSGDLTEVCLMILGNVSEFYVDDFRMHPKGGNAAPDKTDPSGAPDAAKTFLDTLRGTTDPGGNIRLVINDKLIETDQPPLIVNGRVFIPVRSLCEALNAKVGWNDALHKIAISRTGEFIVLTVGSATAIVNGNSVPVESAPVMVGGRTLIPVRFVGEALNTSVDWLDGERIVAVTSK